jgi:hypothetical protein
MTGPAVRFHTLADAVAAGECMSARRPVPPELFIPPFKQIGNLIVQNPEWVNAPYEQIFFYPERQIDE